MNMRATWFAIAIICLAANAARSAPTSVWIQSVVHDCGTAIDDTVRVDVMLNSINDPIDHVGLGVYYHSTSLTFIRAERGALTAAWSSWVTGDGAGPTPSMRQLNIEGSDPTPIPAGISGHFATLVFAQAWCDDGAGTSTSELCVAQAFHDILNIDTYCGAVRFSKPISGSLYVESVYQGCGSALGDTIEVHVRIENTSQPIDAAGVDVAYDSALLEYAGFRRGALTQAWPFFDAAQLPDMVRVGGFTQSPIPGGTSGVFVTLRFVMSCCGSYSSTAVCTGALVDDFATMTGACGSMVCVPLTTRPSTWGYVKSIYR